MHDVTTSLSVVGASHRFDGRQVLDGIDLDVPAGRVVGLLGPNGAGKTTLMRIIFGVLEPDAGEVRWDGREATAADRRRWGYMPQERGLYREMRTIDHLVWLARLYGIGRTEARERAGDLLERLGLSDRMRDPIRELSGGMAQRVQLAAAMVHGPELLVLDEPFAGLDPGAIEFLTDVIHDHVNGGGHLVFSSHQLDLVEDLCETIVMLHDGRVVLQGAVRDLKRASSDRFLQVDVDVDASWLSDTGAHVASSDATGTRLALDPGIDAALVLDRVRTHTAVTDFGVEAPTLSELFLAARRPITTTGSEVTS
ncbi:MAG: ATP-binding cassette domain-containing protein [Ilumatobacteraceae bacterium]|nr:ATP-binding cassette domain-containing protein [Ilumatobacteraceae bacterium]